MYLRAFFLASAFLISPFALAGKEIGNGGDPNEIKFKAVALNIQEWIESGNADSINLPAGLSLTTYKTGMLAKLRDYQIEFTSDSVKVAGVEKTCKNYIGEKGENKILCNSPSFSRYYATSLDDIYRIVHHEFAGLAGFEENSGQDSDYAISAQLSAYLQEELVKRLPVHPAGSEENSWLPALGWLSQKTAAQERPVIVPFTLDSHNAVSLADLLDQGLYKSTATLFEQGVSLEVEEEFYGRKIEMRGENDISILRQDQGANFEGHLSRVPQRGPLSQADYRCTLMETGEEIRIQSGAPVVQFPSQKDIPLASGRLVLTATNTGIFISQYYAVQPKEAGMTTDMTKVFAKFARGDAWAQVKFSAAPGFQQVSVACEML